MKFTVKKENLLQILSAAENICGAKTNFSILSNILLEAKENNKLIVSASNMELSMYAEIEAKIEKKGSITIYEKMLSKIIKELPNEEISFELTDTSMMKIRSLSPKIKGEYDVIGIPKDDFPEIQIFPKNEPFFTFDKKHFKKMIKKTIFAISNDNIKYTLNGVYFEKEGKNVKMIGIDGRRLAYIQKDMENIDKIENFNVIMPQHILAELQRTIDSEGPLKFAYTNNKLFFQFDNFTFTSNIISGKFPNYSLYIPKECKYTLTANTADLINTIKRVSVLVDTESHRVKFHLENGNINISAQNNDYGNANEDIAAEYSQDPMDLGFSHIFLNEILREIETDDVVFSFNHHLSQVSIKEKNREEYFFIIMPMKTSDSS